METRVVAVDRTAELGRFEGEGGDGGDDLERLAEWHVTATAAQGLGTLEAAARALRTGDVPVAFPTETVYGLGADATRSDAVRAIYRVKGRPTDNPLIVHVCDLRMLHRLLGSGAGRAEEADDGGSSLCAGLPAIYRPLVSRFWPGPLTLLLPRPADSPLAAEVTAGLDTFAVRMPASPLARTLIKLAGVPLAAPSANASTRPSPTTARHVVDDLAGRLSLVLDGGPCGVGVESTVVDALARPPAVLRPGGVGIDALRACPGWADVVVVYKDRSEELAAATVAPRAPGMKYKHYSPRARVILYEASSSRGADAMAPSDIDALLAAHGPATPATIGLIRTQRWKPGAGLRCSNLRPAAPDAETGRGAGAQSPSGVPYRLLVGDLEGADGEPLGLVYDLGLGSDTQAIAQALFAALRDLDRRGADTIVVDGIPDKLDITAAVMNRLRKAASETRR